MDNPSVQCYRMRSTFRIIGILFLGFCILVGSASTLGAFFNIDGSFPRPKLTALLFAMFWSAFSCVGVGLLLAHRKYRLLIERSSIRQIGVLRDEQIDLRHVAELKWRRFPKGGSVRLKDSSRVVKIEFGNFTWEERSQLITVLREAIAESKQSGWQAFIDQNADTPERRRKALRAQLLLASVFGLHAVVFAVMCAVGNGMQYLLFSFLNGCMAVYLFRKYRQKQTELELTGTV